MTKSTKDSARERLHQLVELLSEYEAGMLLSAVSATAAGERFWEHDIGLLYNEYVKARYFDLSRNLSSLIPAGPAYDDAPFVPIPLVKSYPDSERIRLPEPTRSHVSVTDAVSRRRSRRDYSRSPLSAAQLSSLLYFSAGTTGHAQGYGYRRWPLRSFPSSGGLQAPEVYLVVQNVDDIDQGLYHYQPVGHMLEMLEPTIDTALLTAIGIGQPYIATAAAVFVVTGYYARINWKYGERSFRYMCMDVGFLGENLYLTAEALGLGTCGIAGFIDDALEHLIGIDPHNEVALYMATVGVPS